MSDSRTGAADSSSDTAEVNALEFAIERVLNRRGTMTLAQVVAVNAGGTGNVGTVDVLPLVNQLDGDGNAVPHQTVYGLPYTRSQGGSYAVVNDPAVGDKGLIFISHEDISSVKATLAQSNPGSRRRGAYEDGVFMGVVIGGASPTRVINLSDPAGMYLSDEHGNVMRFTSAGVNINGALITPSGHFVTPTSVDLNTHVHQDPQGGTTGVPQN